MQGSLSAFGSFYIRANLSLVRREMNKEVIGLVGGFVFVALLFWVFAWYLL